MRSWLWIIILTVGFSTVGNALTHLHLLDPYLLKPNQFLMGFQYGLTAIRYSAVNSFLFMADYGVNENVTVSFQLPYLYMFGDNEAGSFGDMSLGMKFFIANSETLLWRMLCQFDIRFGTGVSQLDAYRRIGDNVESYYPISTGSFSFSSSYLFSLFIESLMVNLVLTYHLENQYDESPFTLDIAYDRIHFQLSCDYPFKFLTEDYRYLIYRPALYLDARLNLSEFSSVPNGVFLTLENVLKMVDDWETALSISLPIISEFIYHYDITLRFGKYF